MVGAIVAKLARRRRFGRQDSAISSALLSIQLCHQIPPRVSNPSVRRTSVERETLTNNLCFLKTFLMRVIVH
jgi:hypothetical protein